MSKKQTKILVCGATGKTGGATTRELLKKGFSVRALAHKVDERSDKLEKEGAEIFFGSMSDYNSMCDALQGIDRVYFVAPWTPDQLHIAITFATAVAASEVGHIVAITQWLSDPSHPAVATRESFLTDQVFDWIPNTSLTKINVGWFADNYMPPQLLAVIAQLGIFPFPLGKGNTAPISNEDIGRVAATVLASPTEHAGKTYRPTGPRLISPEEIAATFAEILGRPVKYQNIPEKMFLKALKYMGMSQHMQSQLRHYIKDYQYGSFERDAPNDVMQGITGSPAEDFETIARRYIAQSPLTNKGFGNKLAAIKGFLTLASTKPFDLDDYAIKHHQPTIQSPRFVKALTKVA